MTEISASAARNEFSELLSRVQYKKERIVVIRRGQAAAALVPMEDLRRLESPEVKEESSGDSEAKSMGTILLEGLKNLAQSDQRQEYNRREEAMLGGLLRRANEEKIEIDALRSRKRPPSSVKPTRVSYRVFLDVPYVEKDEAKALGAKWDADKRKWWVPSYFDLSIVARWNPDVDGSVQEIAADLKDLEKDLPF